MCLYWYVDVFTLRAKSPTSQPAGSHANNKKALCVWGRSLMTLTTVGYGDVTPRTDVEMAWTCIVMFVGTCTFGYIIGNGES